jgi:thioredoxin reductase (NADPH)
MMTAHKERRIHMNKKYLELTKLIRSKQNDHEILKCLSNYHENDIADMLTVMTPKERKRIYTLLEPQKIAEIFAYLDEPQIYFSELSVKDAAKVVSLMDSDDAVDVLETLDDKNTDGTWKITGASGTVYETKTVLLATGAGHRKLGVPGEETLAGAGVSYCATCDGAFFRNKTVAVVGGGDVALEDALYLAAGCEKVYLIHRRQELRGTKVLQEQVANEPKITFLPDTVVKEICGEQMVDHLVIANTGTGEEKELPVSGIFIAVGMNPQTDAVASVLDLDHGYVRAGEDGVTEQPGLFVAGDVRTKKLRQIVTAVADGANSVTSIVEYLKTL